MDKPMSLPVAMAQLNQAMSCHYVSQSALTLEIQLRASLGWGWEDIYVHLLKRGLVSYRARMALRRYVLGLRSATTKRYGT